MHTEQEQKWFEHAFAFAAANQLPEAREAFKEIWRCNPQRTDALSSLARVEREHGNPDLAHQLLSEALDRHPQDSHLLFELGCLFHESGQFELALNYYHNSLKQNPDSAIGWHQLGRLFYHLEQSDKALEAFQQAVHLDPGFASAWNSMGVHAFFRRESAEARSHFQKAIELKPGQAEYYFNLGISCLLEPIDLPLAIQNFKTALLLHPDYTLAILNIGDHYNQLGLLYMARAFYACALDGNQDRFEILIKLAQCAERESEMQAALEFYQQALELKPEQWLIKIRAALLLPLIYQSPEEVLIWQARFTENLAYLHQYIHKENLPRAIQTLSMYSPAFLLAYQGLNNQKLIQSLSDLWNKLLVLPQSQRQKPRSKQLKIGFLSAFFYHHSVTAPYLELIRQLKQKGHQIHCYSVGLRKIDSITQELESLSQWTVLPVDEPLHRIAEKIIAHDLDMMIYPEIGLDPITYFLAHGRLAPIQVQLFGHPISSGIQSIDYFVSSSVFELENAQAHYREELIQLSRCPFYYTRPQKPDYIYSRQELGMPEGNLYFMPATLFKIHPNHDAAFARILDKDPDAQLIFVQPASHQWYDKLSQRFESTLSLYLDRVHFIPWMESDKFYSLLLQADAVLDTVHFAAGNVAYQALGLGVPLITLPGSHLRSRTTYGLYQQMGMLDCVADSWEEYSDLALRMARDRTWHSKMKLRLEEVVDQLFEDKAIITELVSALEGMTP